MPSELPLSPPERAEVLRLFDSHGALEALVYVRRVTGAGLADAHVTVQEILRTHGRLREPARPSRTAEILAVGPFRRELVPFLEYPANLYEGTREGTPMIVHFVEANLDSGEAHALAACFGADPWDFNTHTLDPWRADLEALRELLEEAGDEYVTRFVALRAAGYRFHFLTRAPE
ncbi:hypothetical protein F0U60_22955 [Archangium minus]|uniref:Uncharacterized protein n=1 Tax=Archangium minus TaxID=83450 RepID=A0ABY9WS87_9BACT|nr:hypothetical protein F0U60_22955 [Archangium minus]